MNYYSLYYVCKILVCILYSTAAAVLAFDAVKTYKRIEKQLIRNIFPAISFGAIGIFYFSYLVGNHFSLQIFAKENVVSMLILFGLSVLPVWALQRAGQIDRHIKIYARLFVIIWLVAFPLLFLFPGSIVCLFLQLIIWTGHGVLFYYILRKYCKTVTYPEQRQTGLLNDPSHLFNHVEVDPVYSDLYERLVSYFENEKPYLKPGTNVADVATSLFSNKTYLSRLLNEKLNQNFNQFVNGYRVREAQKVVAEQGLIELSKLCKTVGFASMATFTVAFKLNTGMTPGEWCKNYKRLTH